MITLTEKETLLAQELIDTNDDTDCHICGEDWIDFQKFGWSVNTLKGVFGSLVSKGLLNYVDENQNGEIYQWQVPIAPDKHWEKFGTDATFEIKNVSDLLYQFNKLNKERA